MYECAKTRKVSTLERLIDHVLVHPFLPSEALSHSKTSEVTISQSVRCCQNLTGTYLSLSRGGGGVGA